MEEKTATTRETLISRHYYTQSAPGAGFAMVDNDTAPSACSRRSHCQPRTTGNGVESLLLWLTSRTISCTGHIRWHWYHCRPLLLFSWHTDIWNTRMRTRSCISPHME